MSDTKNLPIFNRKLKELFDMISANNYAIIDILNDSRKERILALIDHAKMDKSFDNIGEFYLGELNQLAQLGEIDKQFVQFDDIFIQFCKKNLIPITYRLGFQDDQNYYADFKLSTYQKINNGIDTLVVNSDPKQK